MTRDNLIAICLIIFMALVIVDTIKKIKKRNEK